MTGTAERRRNKAGPGPRSRLDRLTGLRFLLPLAILVLFGSVLVLAPVGDGPSRVALGVILVIAVLGLAVLSLNLAGRDPLAEHRARSAFGRDPACVGLLTRWLRRSRHFRYVGGLSGFILAVGTWSNGADLGSTAVGVLGGVAAGGAVAELHRRRRHATARIAELTRRRLTDYARPVDLAALAAVALAAIGLAGWSASGGGRTTDLAAVAAAGAVAATTVALMRFVVYRPRPALDPDLRQADELMRRLAATQGFVRPAIAVALVLIAIALDRSGANGSVIAAVWLAGLAWYWLSRQTDRNLRAALR